MKWLSWRMPVLLQHWDPASGRNPFTHSGSPSWKPVMPRTGLFIHFQGSKQVESKHVVGEREDRDEEGAAGGVELRAGFLQGQPGGWRANLPQQDGYQEKQLTDVGLFRRRPGCISTAVCRLLKVSPLWPKSHLLMWVSTRHSFVQFQSEKSVPAFPCTQQHCCELR